MNTRYWKLPKSLIPDWKQEDGEMSAHWGSAGWSKCQSFDEADIAADDRGIIECTADGTPLSELPTARLTLAEFDAFVARIRSNLALLEKEGER